MLQWCLPINLIFALLLSTTAAEAQQLEPKASAQLGKAYQQVLFAYYQGDFAEALTQMAILEQKYPQGLAHIPTSLSANPVEPELLKGGMSLAYGLEAQAEDIFTRLLQGNTSPEVNAYAWLLLGKTYFNNRQLPQAAKAFTNINPEAAENLFETRTLDNWIYMQSQLFGFSPTAQNTSWLEQLSANSIYRQYVQYNQALAVLTKGDTQQGINLLQSLTNPDGSFVPKWMGQWLTDWSSPIFNDADASAQAAEQAAIQDRANLTLGYSLLQNDEPHQAFKAFEKIRTDGIDGAAALLGYGWAAANKNDLQIALAIWQTLIEQPQDSEYTLEAYLASAFAYEQAFAPRQSLAVLQQGLARFAQTLENLNKAEQQVRQRQFILSLLPNNSNDHTRHSTLSSMRMFNSVSVTNEFRAGIVALEQSLQIQQQLTQWQQRMQHYFLMLDERQTERLNRAQSMLQNRSLDKLAQLQNQRQVLADTLADAKKQQNGQLFMGQQSQQWLTRVTRSEQRLNTIAQLKSALGQEPLNPQYAQRVQRAKGRLIWQASEALPSNQWQAQKALNQLDAELLRTATRQQQLLTQLAQKPDFSQQRQRVNNLAQRIAEQIAANNALQTGLIDSLAETFLQHIERHKQTVKNYQLQAQLAIVRLNDQALQKQTETTPVADPVPEPITQSQAQPL